MTTTNMFHSDHRALDHSHSDSDEMAFMMASQLLAYPSQEDGENTYDQMENTHVVSLHHDWPPIVQNNSVLTEPAGHANSAQNSTRIPPTFSLEKTTQTQTNAKKKKKPRKQKKKTEQERAITTAAVTTTTKENEEKNNNINGNTINELKRKTRSRTSNAAIIPLISNDARGGGDPAFHGLKKMAKEQQEEELLQEANNDNNNNNKPPAPRSSQFRGVTKHKRSGRWEAHIWVKETRKQIYLGGYSNEEHAAEAFDIVALKCKSMKNGRKVKLNFPASKYQDLAGYLHETTLEQLIMAVRRQSQGFARGTSGYRGVTLHPSGRWEARIGLPGSKHVYLGLYESEGEAARAYDERLVQLRGPLMATNFAISNYAKAIKVFYEENPEAVESNESAKSAEEKKTTNKSSTTKSTSSSKIKAQKL